MIDKKLAESLRFIYEDLDKHGVKVGVDRMGLDGFINHCALLAGATGAVTGIGGAITMLVGVPIDVVNNVVQQFRVTLAVLYERRGTYSISFDEFMGVVAISLGVEIGVTLTRSVIINIAKVMLVRMGASTAGKALPIIGAVVGATANYTFIRLIGTSVKSLDLSVESGPPLRQSTPQMLKESARVGPLLVENTLSTPISFRMQVRDATGHLQVPTWAIASITAIYPLLGTSKVNLTNGVLAFWAQCSDRSSLWCGDTMVTIGEETIPMRSLTLGPDAAGEYRLRLTL